MQRDGQGAANGALPNFLILWWSWGSLLPVFDPVQDFVQTQCVKEKASQPALQLRKFGSTLPVTMLGLLVEFQALGKRLGGCRG